MSAAEAKSGIVEVVAQSLIQAKTEHTVALTTMGVGGITGSLVLQVFAGILTLLAICKTSQDIWLNSRRIKNEKKDPL